MSLFRTLKGLMSAFRISYFPRLYIERRHGMKRKKDGALPSRGWNVTKMWTERLHLYDGAGASMCR
jgi:hypothetical protein